MTVSTGWGRRFDLRRLTRAAGAAIALLVAMLPGVAAAEVTLIFWSRDTSNYFPHAFVTMKGTLDATGEPVDATYGFTLDDISPIALFKPVRAHIDIAGKRYIRASDAQFSVTITDSHYAAIVEQVQEWGQPASRWSLNRRNCVHFVAEVARRAGLTVIEEKRLMKKPKSFTRSLIALNRDRVTVIGLRGDAFWSKYPEQELTSIGERSARPTLEREVPGLSRSRAEQRP